MTPPDNEPARWLFVCTGNLCRSPMAAGLAPEIAHEHGLHVEIRSRGTAAVVGDPASERAAAVCREIGVELGAHRAALLTEDDVRWADAVLVMEEAHALEVVALVPAHADRIVRLGPYAGFPEIADPYGSWFLGPYRTTRDALIRALRRWLESQRPGPRSRP